MAIVFRTMCKHEKCTSHWMLSICKIIKNYEGNIREGTVHHMYVNQTTCLREREEAKNQFKIIIENNIDHNPSLQNST